MIRFNNTDDLAKALIEAKEAHSRYEQKAGKADENWPAWYAEHMAAAGRPITILAGAEPFTLHGYMGDES